MAEGFIDSASTYEVLAVLGSARPRETYPWAWKSAVTVTSLLISASHLEMAPAPDVEAGASGLYGYLTHRLAEFISHRRPEEALARRALKNTKQWARGNVAKVCDTFANLKNNDSYARWLEWATNNAWLEHSQRLWGLYNVEFIPELSQILGVSPGELGRIREMSRDRNLLEHYATHLPSNDDVYRLLTDAYVISALLRGRYHDYVARKSGLQVVHHPLRSGILSHLKESGKTPFVVSNTERYLSNLVLASAFGEQGHKQRVCCWIESIQKVRKAVSAGEIDTRPKDFDEVALALAVDAAKRTDIRVHPRWIDEVLDATVAVGFGALASFVLNPWAGFATGVVHYGLSKKIHVGKKAAHRIFDTEGRLRDLARSEAGRIEQEWK